MTDLLIRGALVTTSMAHQVSADGKGKAMKTLISGIDAPVPFISANSIRGLIRRAAADVLLESLIDRGLTISRGAYLSLVRGAHSRTGINASKLTFAEAKAAATHIFAGVFGGGSFMFPSNMDIERDAFPITMETLPYLPRDVHHLACEETANGILTRTMMAPRDDFARLPRIARLVVADVEAEHAEHMKTKHSQSKASDSAKASGAEKVKKDDLDNFMGEIECIKPGIPLYFGLIAKNITDAQAGLILMAVHRWANRNVLGGGGARGHGRFKPDLTCVIDGESVPLFDSMTDAPGLKLNPELDGLIGAAMTGIDAQTPDTIDQVYPVIISEPTDDADEAGEPGSSTEKPVKKITRKAKGVA